MYIGVQRRCDAHYRAGRRLGCGGLSRSLRSGGEPLTLAAPWRGSDNSAVLLACRWGGADPCSAAGEESHELDGLCAPTSGDLDGKHDEVAPPGAQELRVLLRAVWL